jgi:mono/diheme cytochrome c family protein
MLIADPGHSSVPVRVRGLSVLLLGLPALLAVSPVGAQEPQPDGVSDSMIVRGRHVFNGPANCAGCHGARGEGTTDGPSLIDGKWRHGSGSFSDIVKQVVHGTPRRESKTGKPMPMRGWAPISDADVQAVAAYVWWLSRDRPREP